MNDYGDDYGGRLGENTLVRSIPVRLDCAVVNVVNVCERFVSIQGESTYAGLPCFFIRLAGCNLRCTYCDTVYAFEPGTDMTVEELVAAAADCGAPLVEITGGEPLLQPGFVPLATALLAVPGRRLLVETNGSMDISSVPEKAIAILDVKCPGSGQNGEMDEGNIGRLRRDDEVKFVLTDRGDYEWASEFVARHRLDAACNAVFFTPARDMLDSAELARWLVEDRLPVRLGMQLHKAVGMR